jgi:hypothetical protein
MTTKTIYNERVIRIQRISAPTSCSDRKLIAYSAYIDGHFALRRSTKALALRDAQRLIDAK